VLQTLRRRAAPLGAALSRLVIHSGVGCFAASYAVSRFLTRRCRGGRAEPDWAGLGLAGGPLTCRAADGVRLAGWVVEPEKPRATVALFHGLRQSSLQALGRSAVLAAAGYRCVAFDHRAHGASGGRRTSFGYCEGRDVAAVADLVRRLWPDEPCAALGISMGAAAVCYSARSVPPWRAVVLESLYADIRSAFANRIGSTYPEWYRPLVPAVTRMTERRLRLRREQLVPLDAIGDLGPVPVMLTTGHADRHASPEDTLRLAERCRGPREMWLVAGAGHKTLFETAGAEEYGRRVTGFLDRWVGARAAESAMTVG
jgi:alpha-beta hydrolase superfamily lysophospholipase